MDILDKLRDLTQKLDSHGVEAETVNSMFIYVAESATDGYFDWIVGSEDEYLSDNFKLQLGYMPDELPNKVSSWSNIIHPEDRDKVHQELTKHFESEGQHPFQVLCRYTHKQGHEVNILCRGSVIEWNNKQPVRLVGIHIKL
jgi:PAS domain S-box-containing protein